jgi:hypothetical protein
MSITKSEGVTPTERLLADLCERSFLRLWSWPNPFKDDRHELCDLIAVFENHVFLFFDREKNLADLADDEKGVLWNRWKTRVIDNQIATAHGAERYLRSGRAVFIDNKCQTQFPLPIPKHNPIFHKIVVAHGAAEACKANSDANINGSLGISYGLEDAPSEHPFIIRLDKEKPIHIFDSANLELIMQELDTFSDLSRYLDEKVTAIGQLDSLIYCGEEDLVAHYFLNLTPERGTHFIGTKEPGINGISIGEGLWADFVKLPQYKATKAANAASYLWDHLIQKTSENRLRGTLGGNADVFMGKSAIREMAKEPRFMRRALTDKMRDSIEKFPSTPDRLTRNVNLMPSYYPDVAYVFLQLWIPPSHRGGDYREKRLMLLELACGAAKNFMPQFKRIIGIGIDAPKLTKTNAEDFILIECAEWSLEQKTYYDDLNRDWNFFRSSSMQWSEETVTEFINVRREDL